MNFDQALGVDYADDRMINYARKLNQQHLGTVVMNGPSDFRTYFIRYTPVDDLTDRFRHCWRWFNPVNGAIARDTEFESDQIFLPVRKVGHYNWHLGQWLHKDLDCFEEVPL